MFPWITLNRAWGSRGRSRRRRCSAPDSVSFGLAIGPGPDVLTVPSPSRAEWFNNKVSGTASCYTALADWQAQTAVPYLTYVRNPAELSDDGSLEKNFPLPWREGAYLQFQVEAISLFNNPGIGNPNTMITDVPTLVPKEGWTGFGTSDTAYNLQRQFMLSLKLVF
jgi:hypothetical protein